MEEKKEEKISKTAKIMAATIFIVTILISAFLINEVIIDQNRSEMHKKHMDAWYQLDWNETKKAYDVHEQYQNDRILMSYFINITSMYPFLHAQGNILINDMAELRENITWGNINKTTGRYNLCYSINVDVLDNVSKYNHRLGRSGLYYNMSYITFEDVIYFDDDRPGGEKETYQYADGYKIGNWSIDLQEINNQLEYVRSIKS